MRFRLVARSVVASDANRTCLHVPSGDDVESHLNDLFETLVALPFLDDVRQDGFEFTGLVSAPYDLDEVRTAMQQRFSDSFCYIRYVSLT
jgi:hypothetical protein